MQSAKTVTPYLDDPDLAICPLPDEHGIIEPLHLDMLYEGVSVFGQTGSGKTSASLKAFALPMLACGFGGLVPCVKTDVVKDWLRFAERTGREADIKIVTADGPYRLNILQYVYNQQGRAGRNLENVTQLVTTILSLAQKDERAKSESFWEDSQRVLIHETLVVLAAAKETLSFANIEKFINSAPQYPEQIEEESWQATSYFWAVALQADENAHELSKAEQRDLNAATDYWLSTFAGMDSKTRSGITTGVTNICFQLTRGVFYDLFNTDTTITPEDIFDGAVILLDLPVHEFGHTGAVAQGIFKYLFQKAAERRDLSKNARPAFLVIDEAQYFLSPHDNLFQTTARSLKVCTIYLSQNVANYQDALGSNGKAKFESLMGNFTMKIFHLNGDHETAKFASETISKGKHYRNTIGGNTNPESGSSISLAETIEYFVQPADFLTLKSGGRRNDYMVSAYLFKPGTIWQSTGLPYRKVIFSQKDEDQEV